MAIIPAIPLLQRLEQATEQHIQTAITQFQNMREEDLLAPAPDGGWSVAQCLDHLNGYGNYYFPLIQRKVTSGRERREEYKPTWLGNYFTKMLDPDTGKKKIKAFKKHIPQRDLDARKVVADFIRQEEQFLQLIRQSKGLDLNKIMIPTSLTRLVRMNLGDTLRFLVAHTERHVRQAGRVGE
jgi:uncharacterized damage-inducible protein DinB